MTTPEAIKAHYDSSLLIQEQWKSFERYEIFVIVLFKGLSFIGDKTKIWQNWVAKADDVDFVTYVKNAIENPNPNPVEYKPKPYTGRPKDFVVLTIDKQKYWEKSYMTFYTEEKALHMTKVWREIFPNRETNAYQLVPVG